MRFSDKVWIMIEKEIQEMKLINCEKKEYSQYVQAMQAFCISAGLEFRFKGKYLNENLSLTDFQVLYKKEWINVGWERNQIDKETKRYYDIDKDSRIRQLVYRDSQKVI